MKFLGRPPRFAPVPTASYGGPIDSQRPEERDRVPWDNGISPLRWSMELRSLRTRERSPRKPSSSLVKIWSLLQ